MRLRITHEIAVRYERALSLAVREIRMAPRTYDGQYVVDWRIDVDHDCRVDRSFDAYGNVLHDFSVAGPLKTLVISAAGEVEVDDTAGVLAPTAREKVPVSLYLRETRLTEPNAAIRAIAMESAAEAGANPLDRCHALMHILSERLAAEAPTELDRTGTSETTAAEALAAGTCGPTGTAHVFIAAARSLGIPARFVSGYIWRGDDRDRADAAHAWAEAHINGLGWVGFDPQNDSCPTDAYVRVSTALDQNGAAFIRGADYGFSTTETTSRASIARADL
jgi:transglutaminase-like putative cysteine protease